MFVLPDLALFLCRVEADGGYFSAPRPVTCAELDAHIKALDARLKEEEKKKEEDKKAAKEAKEAARNAKFWADVRACAGHSPVYVASDYSAEL